MASFIWHFNGCLTSGGAAEGYQVVKGARVARNNSTQ
jgi:hypothetical protein